MIDPTAPATMTRPRAAAPPLPAPAGGPDCPGLTRAGLPCRATPGADGFCCNHSPRFSATDRSNWGKLGALSNLRRKTVDQVHAAVAAMPAEAAVALAAVPDAPAVRVPGTPSFATAESVRDYLERMAKKVEDNRLAPSCAGAIAQFAGLAIKLAELQLARDTLDAEIEAQENGHDPRLPRVSVVA